MKNLMLILIALFIVVGCSSNKKYEDERHEDLERDYVVKDTNSKYRPGWIEDAQGWSEENSLETKSYFYYSFETSPKVGRQIACNLAKANAKAIVAGEIASSVNEEILSQMAGRSSIDENNPESKDLKETISTELNASVAATITGLKIRKIYWEKRFYQKDLGAKKDYNAFTCAVLLQISKENLHRGISNAQKKIEVATKGKMSREDVRKAIERAKKDLKI